MNKYFAIKKVIPIEDYQLLLTFSNKEKPLFDMKPYLNKGIFRELRDVVMFNTAQVSFDTVEWDNEADLDPEVLYDYSKKVTERNYRKVNSPLTALPNPAPNTKKVNSLIDR